MATKAPAGPDWIHEIKHDGYRLMVRRNETGVRLLTRNGHDWTKRFDWIVEAARGIRAKSFLIDGEAVVCGDDGKAVFDLLHSKSWDGSVCLLAFDLLELNGEDWRARPLVDRKARLAKLLARSGAGIRYVDHLDGDGPIIFQHACKLGLEGVVSKRRDAPYRSGRTKAWVKVKNPKAPAALRIEEGTF